MVKKTEIHMMFAWQKRACFLQAAICRMWQEKVGLSWTWGWAGTSQFPWLVSCLGCHRACRKTCLTCLITSLQSCRSWWRELFSYALSASVSSSWMTSQETTYKSNISVPYIIISVVWCKFYSWKNNFKMIHCLFSEPVQNIYSVVQVRNANGFVGESIQFVSGHFMLLRDPCEPGAERHCSWGTELW